MTSSRTAAILVALSLMVASCDSRVKLRSDDMTLGNPDAKLTVVEYASLSSTRSAAWRASVFPGLKTRLDAGEAFYVYRETISAPPQLAGAGPLLARCIAKGNAARYFEVIGVIFDAQSEMLSQRDIRGPLLRIGQSYGLDTAAFNACAGDKPALSALYQRAEQAKLEGVSGASAFVVNGKALDAPPTLAELEAKIP